MFSIAAIILLASFIQSEPVPYLNRDLFIYSFITFLLRWYKKKIRKVTYTNVNRPHPHKPSKTILIYVVYTCIKTRYHNY